MPTLLRESAEEKTAAKALEEAVSLLPKAIGTSEIIGLTLVRAQSLGMLGKDNESCEILNTIKERSVSTPYGETVTRLLKQSCP